jgi:hypothetical protein
LEYWKVSAKGGDILIMCRGHDRERTIAPALTAFRALANSLSTFSILVDLREMTGYETESRQKWQALFREFHGRVAKLILIGARSSMIKMGAAAVGAYAGVPVKFFDSWEALVEHNQRP